jgi:hypothetical protein
MKSLWKKINDFVLESQFFDESGKRRTDPNSKYACFFTAAFSFFRAHYGLRASWDSYKIACLAQRAIREDFYLLNKDKMAIAAGVAAKCFEESGAGIAARALQLVTLGRTCLFSLNGEHYETIVGAEKFEDADGTERLRFLVEDPGGQGDRFADYEDLIVYREDKNGVRVYSKNKKGGKRKITRLYWWQ